MKKTNFILAIGVIAFTACTSTDVVEESLQQNAIGFTSHVNKSSRAINKADDLKQFQVFGSYKLTTSSNRIVNFNDVMVSRENSTAPWSYSDPRYWLENASYMFYAYSNDNSALGTGEGTASFENATGVLNIQNYVADGTHQKDLVFAKSTEITGQKTGNNPVPFTFKHALARIQATFKSGFPAGYECEISEVKVTDAFTTGNFSSQSLSADNVWAISGTTTGTLTPVISTDKNICTPADGTDAAVDVVSGFSYVIPNDYTAGIEGSVSFVFDINVKNSEGEKVLGRTLKATWKPKWEMNKTYNYNITINGSAAGLEKIEFTVTTVDDWDNGTPTLPDIDLGANFSVED